MTHYAAAKVVEAAGSTAANGKVGLDLAAYRAIFRERERVLRELYDHLKDKHAVELDIRDPGARARVGDGLTEMLGEERVPPEFLPVVIRRFVRMLERMDRDADGRISFAEFERALLFTSLVDVGGIMGLVEACHTLAAVCLTCSL